MATIIPCVYNSFSFTRNNIFEDICNVDIKKYPVQKRTGISSSSSSSEPVMTPTPTPTPPPPTPPEANVVSTSNVLYTPNVKNDTLLWCAYIMIHGIEKFDCVENHYIESNTFKFQMVEYIRTKKVLLKPHKISVSSVEDSLVHKPYINLETFQAIAVCYNLSVCIIQDRKIFELGRSDNDKNTFILEKIRGKFGVYIGMGVRDKTAFLGNVREKYWSMENITSPIRSISAYKLQDLIDICRKLEISETKVVLGEFGSIVSEKKKTKSELYEEIVQMIMK
jgi:hypothetical protein